MAAAPHGAWNGELGHSRILCRDSHWDSMVGVGAGMGAGGAERKVAREHQGQENQTKFGKHLDSAGLRACPWVGRKLRNVIIPRRAACCPWAKVVASCPLQTDFQISLTLAYLSPTGQPQLPSPGWWAGPRSQSRVRYRRLWQPGSELFLISSTSQFPVAFLFYLTAAGFEILRGI